MWILVAMVWVMLGCIAHRLVTCYLYKAYEQDFQESFRNSPDYKAIMRVRLLILPLYIVGGVFSLIIVYTVIPTDCICITHKSNY